ncbi:MAG: hypothetical protein CM15mP102_10530 [Flavobacteriales bacterium]|nr:MAG: hypothetical protein CM15mP102_10530 [Flavobacteriales bacterium]
MIADEIQTGLGRTGSLLHHVEIVLVSPLVATIYLC